MHTKWIVLPVGFTGCVNINAHALKQRRHKHIHYPHSWCPICCVCWSANDWFNMNVHNSITRIYCDEANMSGHKWQMFNRWSNCSMSSENTLFISLGTAMIRNFIHLSSVSVSQNMNTCLFGMESSNLARAAGKRLILHCTAMCYYFLPPGNEITFGTPATGTAFGSGDLVSLMGPGPLHWIGWPLPFWAAASENCCTNGN